MELLTLAEAAELTGTNLKALRARADRKSLPTVMGSDGVRRVSIEVLREKGFGIDGVRRSTTRQEPAPAQDLAPLADLLAKMMAENGQLQRQLGHLEREVGSQRLLTEQAESGQERVIDELIEAKATIKALEAQLAAKQPFWKRRHQPELSASSGS